MIGTLGVVALLLAETPSVGAAPERLRAQTVQHAIYAGLADGRIYRSLNHGGSWQEADAGTPWAHAHTAVMALAVARDGRVYAGSNGSINGGATFISVRGVFSSGDGGHHWSDATGSGGPSKGDVAGLAVDPANSRHIYALQAHGTIERSVNGGRTWSSARVGLNQEASHYNAIAVDPKQPETLLAGLEHGMLISTSAGRHWDSAAFPTDRIVWCLAFSPSNARVAYAGTDHGLWRTTDGGTTWNPAFVDPANPLGALDVLAVAVNPKNPHDILTAVHAGLYRSTDEGGTWQPVQSSDVAVNTIAFDSGQPSTVIAGTDNGNLLYVSKDSGADWQGVNPGFGPKTAVRTLGS